MSRDPQCIFCKIAAGEVPAAIVFENDVAIAFLDIAPIAPGHTLLAAKSHVATLADASEELAAGLAAKLPQLARAVQVATGATGLNVVQNNGRDAGQVVPHLHFHLVPRTPKDSLRFHLPQGKYEPGAMDAVRARIAAALS